jgi:hypothetical protein
MKLLTIGKPSSRISGLYSNFQVLYPEIPKYNAFHYVLKGLCSLHFEGVIGDIGGVSCGLLDDPFEMIIYLHGEINIIINEDLIKIDYGFCSSGISGEMSNENVEQFLREELTIKEQK